MSLRYEAPRTRTSVHLVAEIKWRGLIEWTLQRFHELIALDEDATLVLRSCTTPEAAWLAEERELSGLLRAVGLVLPIERRAASGHDRSLLQQ